MSKEPKINADIASLPTKTKTAVVLMIAFGISGVVLMSLTLFLASITGGDQGFLYLCIGLCFLYILPAILIRIKNRIAWIFAVVILCGVAAFIPIIGAIGHSFSITAFIYSLVILIPLIIIIIDRKNYFEMIRQRELEKKH